MKRSALPRARGHDSGKQRDQRRSRVMDAPTGEILAMLGSLDYYNAEIDGQVNVATSERQPGSSFKPSPTSPPLRKATPQQR